MYSFPPPDDGGPAFPSPEIAAKSFDPGFLTDLRGITKRDYFAALAMQSMFAGTGARQVADRDGRYDETNWAEVVAANAYEMADAMLKARER